jgi:Na+-driven multidrug efflux pump
MITAERPQLGLKITLIAGITNMILDALFMGFFGWGL